MFFGVFDFTFVVWLFVGAVSVLVVMGAKEWLKHNYDEDEWKETLE